MGERADNLARARPAGISPSRVKRLERRLESSNPTTVSTGLAGLQRLNDLSPSAIGGKDRLHGGPVRD